jgi:hypothetical protein
LENLKGKDHLENLGIDRNITLEWILMEIGWEGYMWLRIGTSGRPF